ncbi:MAG: FtsX-like permease family protein [Candidatus Moranbacteria bacterium]|nr:FtsX-like permease family protein [Candidatus Moranbacteria bacterium]
MFRQFFTSVRFAIKNLRSNVARTVLTLFGIVIGIMAVIVVSSSGQGVKDYILGQFDSYGDDLIQIETKIPSTSKNSSENAMGQAQGVEITTLKTSDGEALLKIPNVSKYAAGDLGQEIVSRQSENKRTILYGVGANMPDIDKGIKLSEGTFYSDQDDASLAQVAVIGSDIKETFFGNDDAIGKDIKIKGMNFRVIGVAEKRGAVTFFNYDELIYIPVRTLEKKIMGIDHVQFISLKVKDVKSVDVTAADVTDTMRRLHNIHNPDQDDFAVSTMQEARDTIDSVFGTIDILLLALTSISLVVGGVGIMNVMYVAVIERTFEIGLRKSVGARSADIRNQFLLEAVIITLIGGIAGIILGYLVSVGFSYVLASMGFSLKFSITLKSVLISVGFSMGTGIIFGFYPAYKASKLSPMEALRKE